VKSHVKRPGSCGCFYAASLTTEVVSGKGQGLAYLGQPLDGIAGWLWGEHGG